MSLANSATICLSSRARARDLSQAHWVTQPGLNFQSVLVRSLTVCAVRDDFAVITGGARKSTTTRCHPERKRGTSPNIFGLRKLAWTFHQHSRDPSPIDRKSL